MVRYDPPIAACLINTLYPQLHLRPLVAQALKTALLHLHQRQERP